MDMGYEEWKSVSSHPRACDGCINHSSPQPSKTEKLVGFPAFQIPSCLEVGHLFLDVCCLGNRGQVLAQKASQWV